MRLGIFGGSFDPPHLGHLLAAIDAFEQLRLDRLAFVPSSVQPLKVAGAGASSAQRMRMLEAMIGGDPRFALDPVEVDREGLSFTVDTLTTFAGRFPNAERFFLVGADVLTTFANWREPERVVRLARLVVLRRLGDDLPALPPAALAGEPLLLDTRRIDVSSTEIRARARDGKSLRGFVPDAVAACIAAEGLYR
ncbi:MAG: nicotinate-nucleotide adenylyltransferase [Gemmatimonadetes bacterium]|nr:nicotinate-nucleotide adenylyltransferase [Gemmatimonadota bacterium]